MTPLVMETGQEMNTYILLGQKELGDSELGTSGKEEPLLRHKAKGKDKY